LFFIILIHIPVEICLHYHKKGIDEELNVRFNILWNLIKLKIDLPYIISKVRKFMPYFALKAELEEGDTGKVIKKRKFKWSLKKLLKHTVKIAKVLRRANYVIRSIRCKNFSIKAELAGEDAATIGIITGILWAMYGLIIIPVMSKIYFANTQPEISIIPKFNHEKFFTIELDCIFTLKIGHIIIIGLLFYQNLRE